MPGRKFIELIRGHRLEALFSMALCLGARQGEVLGLEWSNLDLDHAKLRIDGALKRVERKADVVDPKKQTVLKCKTKTEDSERSISLPAVTVAALHRQQATQERERLSRGVAGKTPPTSSRHA